MSWSAFHRRRSHRLVFQALRSLPSQTGAGSFPGLRCPSPLGAAGWLPLPPMVTDMSKLAPTRLSDAEGGQHHVVKLRFLKITTKLRIPLWIKHCWSPTRLVVRLFLVPQTQGPLVSFGPKRQWKCLTLSGWARLCTRKGSTCTGMCHLHTSACHVYLRMSHNGDSSVL